MGRGCDGPWPPGDETVNARHTSATARLRVAVMLPLLVLGVVSAPLRARGQGTEHDVKADMLWKIAKFVDWPEAAFNRSGQLVFAILGEDELAAVLASSLSTRTINGKQVFVRFVRRPQDAQGAQILYVSASERERLPEVLRALEGTSTLTVADVPGFVAHGGMVDFISEADRVRFQINPGRAQRAGLKISAKLLALAKVVEDGPLENTSARTP